MSAKSLIQENDPLTFNIMPSAKPPTLRLLYSRKHPDLTSSRDICLKKANGIYPFRLDLFSWQWSLQISNNQTPLV